MPGANWHEREAHEMFGIDFVGHPNLIKLYLPDGFEGYPLQKSFPLLTREVKPWPGTVDVEGMPGRGRRAIRRESGSLMVLEQDLVRHLVEAAVTVELATPDMTLNIGPQHPSTHGVLRLVAQVDGERTTDVQPVIGYMHRGYEKISEVRTYPQITALINRIDWVSGYANEIPFIVAAERLMELEVPERAQYIRLILTEMARISSHLVFNASYPLELGAATPLFFALRDRERVLDLLESVTGGRFHPNFNRIGGVKPAVGSGSATRKMIQDLPKTFLPETRDAMDKVLATCDEIEDLVAGNEIILARTKGIGIIPPEVAAAYGLSGPNLRASGVGFDLRKVSNYLPYDKFSFS